MNVVGRFAVVIGGGSVGRRKALAAAEAGAAVRLVALEQRPAGFDSRIEWIAEPYRAEHLDGAVLVFAAAGPVNAEVVADAHARHLLVNDASEPDRGDFLLPAVHRQGALAIAVSTGGASPTVATQIRDRLAAEYDSAYADWLALLAEFRPQFTPDQARAFADWQWLDRIRRDGVAAVREEMRANL